MPLPAVPFSLMSFLRGELPNVKLQARLFVNDLDPALSPGLGDFVEPTFAGYQPQFLEMNRLPVLYNPVSAKVSSKILVFGHSGADLSEAVILGAFIVAVYPGGETSLAIHSVLDRPVNVGAEYHPFGLSFFLNARLSVV